MHLQIALSLVFLFLLFGLLCGLKDKAWCFDRWKRLLDDLLTSYRGPGRRHGPDLEETLNAHRVSSSFTGQWHA